jgi:hypothetical protein
LNWKIKKSDQIFNLGQMHLNKLNQIKAIKGEKFKLSAIGQEDSDCEPNSDNDTDDEANNHGKQEES